jgi:hypothetical protein
MRFLRFAALLVATSAAALAAVVSAPRAQAVEWPEPSAAPVEWQLDLEQLEPRRIEVDGTAYWYLPYTVINRTDEERTFFPLVEMVTREGNVLRAEASLPNGVFDAISRRTRSLPLETPGSMMGRILLIGESQRLSSVAVWEEPLAEMGTFTLYFGGLSGETKRLTKDDGTPLLDAEGNPIRVYKTRELVYRIRGDDRPDSRDPILLERERWVMR